MKSQTQTKILSQDGPSQSQLNQKSSVTDSENTVKTSGVEVARVVPYDSSSDDDDQVEEVGATKTQGDAVEERTDSCSNNIQEEEENENEDLESERQKDASSGSNQEVQEEMEEQRAETETEPVVETSVVTEEEAVRNRTDSVNQGLRHADSIPKRKTVLQYATIDNIIEKAEVLSTQPKKDGKWQDWVNVRVLGSDKPSSVNWKNVLWWLPLSESVNQTLVLSHIDMLSQEVVDAKTLEMNNLKENDVFEVVPYVDQFVVSCRWIVEERSTGDGGKKIKARLVARGFEEDLLNTKVDSPTCSRQALRIVFSTASTFDWDVKSLDVKSAFLQGKPISREVYVMPPADVREENKVWKLKRCLYGLNDAPREWYNKLSEKLVGLGAKVSLYDKALFMWHKEGKLVGVITTHVDDLVHCGTQEWEDSVLSQVKREFKISKSGQSCFRYIGLQVEQNGSELYVNQKHYIQEFEELDIAADRKKDLYSKLTKPEMKMLRSACGQLLWVTSQTRPDVAFQGCKASNHGKEATVESLLEVNKAIRKLKATDIKLRYPALGNVDDLSVMAYGDATHNSLPSGGSQEAMITFLSGNGKVAPITWKSKKIDRVTRSPLASEVCAIVDASDAGYLVAEMAKELYQLEKTPKVHLYTDSKSLKQNLESTHVIQDPRLRVDMARLKQMIDLEEMVINWVPSQLQLADSLTKKGASADKLIEVLRSAQLQ